MTPEQADRLGKIADELDACLYASKMSLPPAIHISALTSKMREARDEIAAIVREVTGDDPWATNPLAG